MPGPFFVVLNQGNIVLFKDKAPGQLGSHHPRPDNDDTHILCQYISAGQFKEPLAM
jgi:hypothetical protein